MGKPTKLDNIEHAGIRVDPRMAAEFGSNVNQALVFPNEFQSIAREYAIFFRKDDSGNFYAVAMLGLEKDENLFLDDDGWNARTIPATQQLGPFSIGAETSATAASPNTFIQIDVDHPRVTSQDGAALFLEQGGHSPYLQHVERVIGTVEEGARLTPGFFAALKELDLIESVHVNLGLSDTESYAFEDVFSISEENFAKLSGAALEQMHQSGLMALCFWVLASRGNLNYLAQLRARRAVG